ncbi:MAG TPA: 4Fe-4S dicluster domain-containing protein [Candidatus Rifleibacterium sp.]|nr:4Fe-4S dicluster domain-containing protein [Candidatus Rifleibacterium sp.]HPT44995.1 4Fe-4S dicluster domain-containing protein [Candidatus Rifleibacterium sp.]
MDRKSFFKNYFLDLFDGIDTAFGEELDGFAARFPDLVRPPGACAEKAFLEKCTRCGQCVKACPFFALKPVLMANEFDLGTPALRVGEAWCRFCENLPCITACASGALTKGNHQQRPKIALASIKPANCLRSHENDCQACYDKCPAAQAAISIQPATAVVVDPERCNGCGACLTVCPAYPEPAIILKPL